MTRWKARAVFLCLLLLFFGQMAFGARHLSLTADEPAHIVRGYVYLTSDDFWMVPILGHPPVIEGWAALPLLLNPDRPRPAEVPHWKESTALYIQDLLPRLGTVAQLEVLTRVPVMMLAVVLMALTFRWASELAGAWGGLWATILMAWDPTMIAHSQLDTTDLGATLFIFACAYMFWKMVRTHGCTHPQPAAGRAVATGVLAGLAMGAKHSGAVTLPLLGLLVVWGWYRTAAIATRGEGAASSSSGVHRRHLIAEAGRWATWGLVMLFTSVLVLWAVYRFETERLAGPPWLLPLPSHIQSLRALFEGKVRLAFARGQLREGGWWWYPFYIFFIKTPLPFIAAILFSFCYELRRGKRAWLQHVPLWLLLVLYWGITMRGEMNIGFRHLLPTFPFMYVLAGQAIAGGLFVGARPGRWVTVVLAAWYVLGTWRVYPYPLAYFNELAGGPTNGYRHAVDSNVDWGHSFKALAQYMRQAGIAEVRLSYWTWVDPALYGVRYTPLPPAPDTEGQRFPSFAPPAGIYAISATTLQGILLRDADLYEWFRHQPPVAQPGYGLLVYRVEEAAPAPTWVGQCSVPVPPLPPSEIEQGFGGQVRRVAYFDCTQAWLYPDGGQSSGWFILHQDALRDAPRDADAWISSCLAGARLSYTHRQPGTLPPFSIYEWRSSPGCTHTGCTHPRCTHPPHPPLSPPTTSVFIPADPARPGGGLPVSAPVSFEGPLMLQGYRIDRVGEQAFELQTWWEVGSPTARPFSLMGHVVDTEGRVLAVADGLGIPLTEMRQGDWFVQRHRFLLDENTIANLDVAWFQTGGYWLDTMERWPVLLDGKAVGDRVILTGVELSGQ